MENKYNCKLIWSSEPFTQKSTSAGGFYIIAKEFFVKHKELACVYGSAFTENNTVSHIRVTSIDELYMLQGSKYVQSSLYNTLNYIKHDLDIGKYVLFSGTACQTAAVTKFIGNNERLFTIDILCHGVPSQKLWLHYLDAQKKKYGGEIDNISFRNKSKNNRLGYVLKFVCNSKQITKYAETDFYYKSFIDGLSLRPSCYECPFVGSYFGSDLTLADSNNNRFHPVNAISLCIIRTSKGESLFNILNNFCDVCDTDYYEESKTNKKLIFPTIRPVGRDSFYDNISSSEILTSTNLKKDFVLRIKNSIPTWIKRRIKGEKNDNH